MTDQPHLSQFIATDKGANLTFVGYSANDAGSVLGVVRERKGRDEIKGQLHMFMQQFAKK